VPAKRGARQDSLPAEGMPVPAQLVHMSFGAINTHLPAVDHAEDYIGTQILGIIRGRISAAGVKENASGVRQTQVTVMCEIEPITTKQMVAAMGEGWEFPAKETEATDE
jgi:hypothetical protein